VPLEYLTHISRGFELAPAIIACFLYEITTLDFLAFADKAIGIKAFAMKPVVRRDIAHIVREALGD